jgi:hypothetical protein
MADSEYLRRQAQLLKQWARNCFDLTTAERLRHMATEFEDRAEDDDDIPPAYMREGNGQGGGMDRD